VLKSLSGRRGVLVTTHRNADPDAVASVFLACRALAELGSECCALFPEGLSKSSKKILKELEIGVKEEVCEKLEAVLIVDASNLSQLGEAKKLIEAAKEVYLVDHHRPGDLLRIAKRAFIDENSTSNTQILVNALAGLGLRADERLATLALAGIIYDSRRFQMVDLAMLDAVKRLMLWGGSYSKALELLSTPREETSLRMAKLKAAQRLLLGRACKDILIAVTRIGSYESKVARALVDLGADVAVVVGYHDDEIRVSIRLSQEALRKGVDASEVAKYLSEKLGGSGGGHEAAGMLHIKLERLTESEIERVVEEIAKSLPGKVARMCVSRGGRS